MNLLTVSVVFPPAWRHGGTPVTAHAVAKALIHAGHSVKAVTTGCTADGISTLDRWTEWDGVPVVYCHKFPLRYLSYAPSLASTVRQVARHCDVALIRSIWQHTGPTAARVCRKMGLPYLAYPEGAFDPWGINRGALRRLSKAVFWRFFDQPYFRQAAAVAALTRAEADATRAMGLCNRVEVIPNGVDPAAFQKGATRDELGSKYPQIRNRRIVLFLSRLHPVKGLLEMLPAAPQITCAVPEAILVIAGPSEEGYEGLLRKRVAELGIGNHVLFTGPLYGADKVGVLQAAEVFVLPSFSEGFPVVVAEAMACAKPVVLTKGCHLPEVAEAGAGIEISRSPDEFARAVIDLLRDDDARRQMGQNGYNLVQQRFTWDRVAAMTADLCADIIR